MDAARKFDLEDLAKMLERGDLTRHEREEIGKTMQQIMHQSPEVSRYREQLVRATRHSDTRTIRKVQEQLLILKQRDMNGRQF